MAKNITHIAILEKALFQDNKDKSRFELHADNATAYVDYIHDDDTISLYKTEIPQSIANIDNSATYLMTKIVEYCIDHSTKLDIYCPFAKAVVASMGAIKKI